METTSQLYKDPAGPSEETRAIEAQVFAVSHLLPCTPQNPSKEQTAQRMACQRLLDAALSPQSGILRRRGPAVRH